MPRLLSAERPAAPAELVQDIAVADRGRRDLDALLRHRRVEAVVGHHRDRDPVTGEPSPVTEVKRRQRDQLVSVNDYAVAIDREHAVAIAVESEPDVVLAR